MSAPLLWIIFPILISILLLIFRKNYLLVCLVQIILCSIIIISAILARFVTPETTSILIYQITPSMNILGRSLIFTSGLKTTMIFSFSALVIWSLSLLIFKIKSNIVPFGITFIGLLIAALAVEPFLYSALIIEIAVVVSIPIFANATNPRIKGVSRYLIYFTIGMPFILLAGWYLAGGEISPVNDEQLIQAALLLGLGFIFWLAVFPFQSWIPLLAEETEPIEGFFVLTILPMAIAMLLMKYLNGFAWLRGFITVFQALRLFGLIMIVFGSIWFSFQKNLRKAISYLLLVSSGLVVVALSFNSSDGYIFSSYFMLLRLICFFLLSMILMVFEKTRENNSIVSLQLKALFKKSPITALVFFIPLFSLVGMPWTVGFPIMQSLFSELAIFIPQFMILLLLSLIIISITIIRWIFISIKNDDDSIASSNLGPQETAFLLVCVLGMIIIGIFPNIIYPHIGSIVSDLQFLVK